MKKADLKIAKQEMKEKSRPYQTYGYYLSIPMTLIVLFVLSFLGIDLNTVGTIIFIFTIMANIEVSKLTLVSKRKYTAPILMYVATAISFILLIAMFSEISSGGTGDIFFGGIGLIAFPIEIVAIIFFFITANDIKKAYPTMKQDAKDAREAYIAIKKNN